MHFLTRVSGWCVASAAVGTAVQAWRLLLERRFSLLDSWCGFVMVSPMKVQATAPHCVLHMQEVFVAPEQEDNVPQCADLSDECLYVCIDLHRVLTSPVCGSL